MPESSTSSTHKKGRAMSDQVRDSEAKSDKATVITHAWCSTAQNTPVPSHLLESPTYCPSRQAQTLTSHPCSYSVVHVVYISQTFYRYISVRHTSLSCVYQMRLSLRRHCY